MEEWEKAYWSQDMSNSTGISEEISVFKAGWDAAIEWCDNVCEKMGLSSEVDVSRDSPQS